MLLNQQGWEVSAFFYTEAYARTRWDGRLYTTLTYLSAHHLCPTLLFCLLSHSHDFAVEVPEKGAARRRVPRYLDLGRGASES